MVSNMKHLKCLMIRALKHYPSTQVPVRFISSKKLVFNEFGDPAKVVHVVQEDLPKVQSTEVSTSKFAFTVSL